MEVKAGKIEFAASGEFHWQTAYTGSARWNLREDLAHPQSFHHSATGGTGVVAAGSMRYLFGRHWSLRAAGQWEQFKVGPGINTTYFADGTSGSGRLNQVEWNSYSATLSAAYRF